MCLALYKPSKLGGNREYGKVSAEWENMRCYVWLSTLCRSFASSFQQVHPPF